MYFNSCLTAMLAPLQAKKTKGGKQASATRSKRQKQKWNDGKWRLYLDSVLQTHIYRWRHPSLSPSCNRSSRRSQWRHPSLPLSRNSHWRYPFSPPISQKLLAVPILSPYLAIAVGGTPLPLSPSQPIPSLALAVQASRQCQWRHLLKKPTPSVICYKWDPIP